MPYKKPYQASTMKSSIQKVTGSHMGHQGHTATIPVSHFQNKSTDKTPHPAGKSNSKGAKKFNHG